MSFGMRIWGANGALQLDETSFTVRVVYSALVSSTGAPNVSIPIAGVDPSTHTAICLPNVAWSNSTGGQSAAVSQFDAQVVAGGVVVWFVSRVVQNGRFSAGTQRLLVFKYR